MEEGTERGAKGTCEPARVETAGHAQLQGKMGNRVSNVGCVGLGGNQGLFPHRRKRT